MNFILSAKSHFNVLLVEFGSEWRRFLYHMKIGSVVRNHMICGKGGASGGERSRDVFHQFSGQRCVHDSRRLVMAVVLTSLQCPFHLAHQQKGATKTVPDNMTGGDCIARW